jgi:hypothetical protein
MSAKNKRRAMNRWGFAKRAPATALVVVCALASLSAAAQQGPPSVSKAATTCKNGGTPINTADDLNNVRNNLSGVYCLAKDIDLSTSTYKNNWTPIGDANSPFSGALDGHGYTIGHLVISSASNQPRRCSERSERAGS